MDCLRAQELVSAAIDNEPVDLTELAEARAHCHSCARCASFERVQLALDWAPVPEPPADLVDRVMEAIRAEAAAAEPEVEMAADPDAETTVIATATISTETATAKGDAAQTAEERETAPLRGLQILLGKAKEPRNRKAVVTWVTAAAVLLLATGIGAVAGVRAILSATQAVTDTAGSEAAVVQSDGESNREMHANDDAAGVVTPPVDTGSSGYGVTVPSPKAAKAPDLITIDGVVYRLDGRVNQIDHDGMIEAGRTRSTLGRFGPAREWKVIGKKGISRVYIEADDDDILAFVPIMRAYGGRAYVLRSAPIKSFGEWPELPQGIRTPTSPDGSPTFTRIDTDDLGIAVYARSDSADAGLGIAIAPMQPAADPLAGCPRWTWWEPAR